MFRNGISSLVQTGMTGFQISQGGLGGSEAGRSGSLSIPLSHQAELSPIVANLQLCSQRTANSPNERYEILNQLSTQDFQTWLKCHADSKALLIEALETLSGELSSLYGAVTFARNDLTAEVPLANELISLLRQSEIINEVRLREICKALSDNRGQLLLGSRQIKDVLASNIVSTFFDQLAQIITTRTELDDHGTKALRYITPEDIHSWRDRNGIQESENSQFITSLYALHKALENLKPNADLNRLASSLYCVGNNLFPKHQFSTLINDNDPAYPHRKEAIDIPNPTMIGDSLTDLVMNIGKIQANDLGLSDHIRSIVKGVESIKDFMENKCHQYAPST